MTGGTSFTVDNTIRTKAWVCTIAVHALLLLLFFFIKYTVPVIMPVEEIGMEVNLGTDADGSGDDQPMDTEEPAASVALHNSGAARSSSSEKEWLESNDPDAPVIKRTTSSIPNTGQHSTNTSRTSANNNPLNSTQQVIPQTQKPRYVYDGANGRGGNSATDNHAGTSEGNTTGNGDRGVPAGTPGAANYEGSPGTGTGGISHTLSGREISPKRFSAEFNEGGKVVIRIKVDRKGTIISKSIKSSPSATLSQIALQKLNEAKFSPSPNAAPEQFGEITIVFKTRS